MTKYNGIIVVDKEPGIGSTDCVRTIKKTLGIKKVGHSGTLDFMATGVLAICLGKATKLIEYLQNEKKTYIAGIKFGIETDTLDSEGSILNKTDKLVDKEEFKEKLKDFVGEINQVPPMFSALKHKGKRLYDLARQGITIDRESRAITIYSLELLDFNFHKQEAVIKCSVSSGTYIRTLIDDLGKSLDNYAHMISLRRTECSGFKIDQSILLSKSSEEDLLNNLIPLDKTLENFEKIVVDEDIKKKLLNGMTVLIEDFKETELIRVFDEKNFLLGIGNILKTGKGTMLKLIKHLYIDENI